MSSICFWSPTKTPRPWTQRPWTPFQRTLTAKRKIRTALPVSDSGVVPPLNSSQGVFQRQCPQSSSVRRTEESSIESTPKLCRKLNTVHLPPAEIILMKEADVGSKVDLTEVEPRPSPPLARPKHSEKRQLGGPLRLAKLTSILNTRIPQLSCTNQIARMNHDAARFNQSHAHWV